MRKQYVPRHSLTQGAAKARNLIADTAIAPHIRATTIEYLDEQGRTVIRFRRREAGFVLGRVVVLPGQVFWLVASKFPGRYYVVLERDGEWQCSSREDRVGRRCIAAVKATREAKRAA